MIVNLVSLLLVCSCGIISLISLLNSPWTSFEVDSLQFTHSLLKSLSAPGMYEQSDYSCLSNLACTDSSESNLCNISQKLARARSFYLGFELGALIITIFLAERLCLKLLNKPYGSPRFFLFLAWVFPLVKCTGLLCFLMLSNISLEKSSKSGEVISEYGIDLAFAALALCIVSSVVMIISKLHRPLRLTKIEIVVSTTRFLNPLLIFTISQVMLVLSSVYPTASYNEFSVITLNLHYVNQYESLQNLPIACITGQECQNSNEACVVFNALDSLEKSITVFEGIGYLFLVLWAEALVHLLLKLRIGTNALNYLYPVLYVICSSSGFVYYLVKSNVSYGANCNIENFGSEFQLCAELGTTFYMIGSIFTVLAMITYELAYAIYSATAGISMEGKIHIEPDDMKKAHVKELSITDLDKTADKTSSEITTTKNNDDIINITQIDHRGDNSGAQFCGGCMKQFMPKEIGITEGKKKYHYKCYVSASN